MRERENDAERRLRYREDSRSHDSTSNKNRLILLRDQILGS